MKRWALINNNIVETIVDQEELPTVFNSGVRFWKEITGTNIGPRCKYDASTKTFSQPDPEPILKRRVDIIDGLGDDYEKIIMAAKTDVQVEVWLEKFRLKDLFNVIDSSVKTDFQFLVTKNLITQQKANIILNS